MTEARKATVVDRLPGFLKPNSALTCPGMTDLRDRTAGKMSNPAEGTRNVFRHRHQDFIIVATVQAPGKSPLVDLILEMGERPVKSGT